MPQFRNLSDLQKYLEHNVAEVMEGTAEVERALIDAMVEEVIRVVYDAYTPGDTGAKNPYVRRGEDDGLADPRNMMITGVNFFPGGRVHVTFENLARGNDNLSHTLLTDTIVEGIKSNWDVTGPWSQPRDFVAATADNIRNNPTALIHGIKKGLSEKGFKVK